MDKRSGDKSDSSEDDPSSPQENTSLVVEVEVLPTSSTPVSKEQKKFKRIEGQVKDAFNTLTAEEKATLITITQKRFELWHEQEQLEKSEPDEGEQGFRRKCLSVPAADQEDKFSHDISKAMESFFSNANDASKNTGRLVRSDGSGGSYYSTPLSPSQGGTGSSNFSLSSIDSSVDFNKAFLEDPDLDEVFVDDTNKGNSEIEEICEAIKENFKL